ncbi:unnamed protein product [Acanthoscelides obtectus]|uniref:Uncharacterized protein n=1 Tax=Acanthoscelides obtectus TaxID=200917 RepID=A0A9P0PEE1_ACAOB|nr:unnamed protein product [Acanthoscelides obtectus]CAK1647687.1 hypothetical protein AOBTE_LOCUS15341 [Acanthoscelides obtectus]
MAEPMEEQNHQTAGKYFKCVGTPQSAQKKTRLSDYLPFANWSYASDTCSATKKPQHAKPANFQTADLP